MKVIFLDIDGVLNSERSFLAGAHRAKEWDNADDPYYKKITKATIDTVAVDLVNRIMRELDVYIVLSSTHRMHFDAGENKRQLIQEYLTFLGLDGSRCVGYTPRYNAIRGVEIKAVLDVMPEITHYVILDDSSDMLPEQMEFFVRCDGKVGVTAENYFQMSRLFGREDSGIILP